MPRMSKKLKHEWSLFLNHRGRRCYNSLCRRCIHSCKQSFHATVVECPRYFSKRAVARIGFNLISNHAFVDGNKRIGMHIMLTFLLVNGIRLNCTNEDVVEAGLGVASGAMGYEELLLWIRNHRES